MPVSPEPVQDGLADERDEVDLSVLIDRQEGDAVRSEVGRGVAEARLHRERLGPGEVVIVF